MSLTLLFDLDDTLVPSTKSYDHGLLTLGLKPDDSLYLQARADVKAACPPGYPGSRSRRLYFKRMLQNQGTYTPQFHLDMIEGYESAVCEFLGKSWRELGRPALFTELRGLAHKIGIVTNESSAFQSAKLNALDPDWNFFDFVVASEDLGREKPAREMFERALTLAGARPQDCVMIGDSLSHDIEGAAALGIRGIQTVEFLPSASVHTAVVRKLADLPGLLRA